MTNDISSKLKQFKKDLVKFKKKASGDKEEGLELANNLIKDIKLFQKREDLPMNEKQKKQLAQTKEGLELYVKQIEAMLKFEKKWN